MNKTDTLDSKKTS